MCNKRSKNDCVFNLQFHKKKIIFKMPKWATNCLIFGAKREVLNDKTVFKPFHENLQAFLKFTTLTAIQTGLN